MIVASELPTDLVELHVASKVIKHSVDNIARFVKRDQSLDQRL